jgi:iron complex outermembrane recepter protein
VRRDASGTLNSGPGIITQSANLGTFLVEGVDLDVKYRLPLKNVGLDAKWGRVDLALTASLLDTWQVKTIPTVASVECAGQYGLNCGNPYFKTRFTQRATWNVGAFSLGYEWRYYSSVDVEASNGTTFADYRSIPERNYIDLNGSWDVTKNFTVSAVIRNVRDSGPPIVGNTIGGTAANSGNTFPQWYDVVGRAYSVTAKLKF